jgi:uncharacterized membrane protein
MAKLIGAQPTNGTRNAMMTMGLREIATGVGILTQPQSPAWLWARVGGDMIDLALLGTTMTSKRGDRTRAAVATAAVLGVTVLDIIASRQRSQNRARMPIHVKKTITINRSPGEIYDFWHDFEHLPQFMAHLESVQVLDTRRSHWKAKAPAGTTVEWDAEILQDVPGESIAWRSTDGADVPNAGTVRFLPAPGARGTEVHVELQYDPPAGAVGKVVAKLFGEEPGQQIAGDLRRLKQVMETGEVVHSDASIHRGMHAAQPAAAPRETMRVES